MKIGVQRYPANNLLLAFLAMKVTSLLANLIAFDGTFVLSESFESASSTTMTLQVKCNANHLYLANYYSKLKFTGVKCLKSESCNIQLFVNVLNHQQ